MKDIKPINHYSMNNPASVYDEESLTALQLASRTAGKVNECADRTNENTAYLHKAVEDQNTEIDEAKKYMVDNLPNFVENSVENLKNKGDLETMLVNAVSSRKVDKNGVGQINWGMLDQTVKENITGGNTPVVGEDSVSTHNIVNNSIHEVDLRRVLHSCEFYVDDTAHYYKPLLIIDTSSKTAVRNTDFTKPFYIQTRETQYPINPTTISVNTAGWTSNNPDIYFNPDNNEILIANGQKSTSYEMYVYLGGFNFYGYGVTSVIPVSVNGQFYMGNYNPSFKQLPMQVYNTKLYQNTQHLYQLSSAIFDFNFSTKTVTFLTTNNISFTVEGYVYTVSMANATAVVDVGSGSHCQLFVNPFENKFYFVSTASTFANSFANCLYLGLITKQTVSMSNTCILPYTLDSKYYMHPNVTERPRCDLILSNSVASGSPVVAKVDFKNREMIIPANTQLTIAMNSNYIHMTVDTTNDLVIPFGSSDSNHQYLVGGENGLMFVPYSTFRSMSNSRDKDQLYYFGYVNETNKDIHLRCEAKRCRTYSVLGDSISTYLGVIPEEHTAYYDGTQGGITHPSLTWWGRVANACGLKLGCNIAWSGLRVTPRPSNPSLDGLKFAEKIDDYCENSDIIFVYIGINDFNNNITLGDMSLDNLDIGYKSDAGQVFAQSYLNMLARIKAQNIHSEIYCLTLPNCQRTDSEGDAEVFVEKNESGVWLHEFNDAIRKACKLMNVNVIDTDKCKFTTLNNIDYFVDANKGSMQWGFLHPNAEGMKVIANKVIKAVLDTEECD